MVVAVPWLVSLLVLAPLASIVDSPAPEEGLDPRPWLSPVGRDWIDDPALAAIEGEALGLAYLEAAGSASALLQATLGSLVDGQTAPVPLAPLGLAGELERAWLLAGEPLGVVDAAQLRDRVAALPAPLEEALATLVAATTAADAIRGEPFAALSTAELAELAAMGPMLPGYDLEVPEGGAAQLLPEEITETGMERRAELMGRVDVAAIQQSQAVLAAALDAAYALLADLPAMDFSIDTAPPGDIGIYDSPYGRIVVSGQGRHTYTQDDFITVDLGGDDTYRNHPGTARGEILDASLSLVNAALVADPNDPGWRAGVIDDVRRSHDVVFTIDLQGDDTYVNGPADGPTQGSGSFGAFGALLDGAGDDTYSAWRHAQGDGQVAGVGLLLDLAGADTYTVDAQGQGFGQTAGVGILADGDGADVRTARVVAQGLGWDAGAGVLVDGAGNDDYTCWGVDNFSDSILPVNLPRPGTTCQGTGWGGAGAIVDGEGQDTYFTTAGFQAMNLIGTSLAFDGTGDDQRTAGEWSLAVGVVGASAIIDGAGDDVYDTQMVLPNPWIDIFIGGNGEGYLGVGVIADGAGDDTYLQDVRKDLWIPQFACGAGCAHDGGVGILVDGAGNDHYVSENGQGATTGGVGVLIDGTGDDDYDRLYGSTRLQGFAGFDSSPYVGSGTVQAATDCIYGLIWDLDGTDAYSNPATDFGTRGDDRYWGQGEMGRGMDGDEGTLGYLQSPEFEQDRDRLVGDVACNTVTPIVLQLIEQFL
ncbi:MAG: hypothetical protein ACPGQL_09835 [Thermoplasmatota archaeon]